jgi:hypothetical protein
LRSLLSAPGSLQASSQRSIGQSFVEEIEP